MSLSITSGVISLGQARSPNSSAIAGDTWFWGKKAQAAKVLLEGGQVRKAILGPRAREPRAGAEAPPR